MNHCFQFPKDYRLLSKSDFQNLKKGSCFCRSDYLLAFFKKSNSQKTRIGFAISKKVGNAVRRNKIKRILRETFRQSNSRELFIDVLITVNLKALNAKGPVDYVALRNDFKMLLNKLKKFF